MRARSVELDIRVTATLAEDGCWCAEISIPNQGACDIDPQPSLLQASFEIGKCLASRDDDIERELRELMDERHRVRADDYLRAAKRHSAAELRSRPRCTCSKTRWTSPADRWWPVHCAPSRRWFRMRNRAATPTSFPHSSGRCRRVPDRTTKELPA